MEITMITMTRTMEESLPEISSPDGLSIAVLTQDDMESLCDEIASCFKGSLFSITPERTRELFKKRREQGKDDSLARWYVARCNNEVAGVLLMGIKPGSDIISLGQFAVKPQFRCRGIGKYLTFRALSDVQKLHDKIVILYTDKDNYAAISLYQKFGFRISNL